MPPESGAAQKPYLCSSQDFTSWRNYAEGVEVISSSTMRRPDTASDDSTVGVARP
jgi:hypothetical protein